MEYKYRDMLKRDVRMNFECTHSQRTYLLSICSLYDCNIPVISLQIRDKNWDIDLSNQTMRNGRDTFGLSTSDFRNFNSGVFFAIRKWTTLDISKWFFLLQIDCGMSITERTQLLLCQYTRNLISYHFIVRHHWRHTKYLPLHNTGAATD